MHDAYPFGKTHLHLFLLCAQPPIEFSGYEEYLPAYYFNFTSQDVLESTGSDLFSYPILADQEFLLRDGIDHPNCALIPPFSEEYDAPVFGKLPNGEWLQYTPTINLESNGPEINDVPDSNKVLPDGGGSIFIQTGEKVKCSNVARSIFNEATCYLSTNALACSSSNAIGEIDIPLNKSNIHAFYEHSDRYVYAITGLVNDEIGQHPCMTTTS